MGKFEEIWKSMDASVDRVVEVWKSTLDGLQKEAENVANKVWNSFISFATNLSNGLSGVWQSVKQRFNNTVEWGKLLAQDVRKSITSLWDRVNSLGEAINAWVITIVQEWKNFYVQTVGASWEIIKLAIEKVSSAGRETLTYVNWKLEYVIDETSEFIQNADDVTTAVTNVVGNTVRSTFKPFIEEYENVRTARKNWNGTQEVVQQQVEVQQEYSIRAGDTLSKIALNATKWNKVEAEKYLKQIVATNNITDANRIFKGQKIILSKLA